MQAEKKLVAMPPWCTSEMTRVFIYYSNSSSGIGKAVALTMAMLQMRIATFQVVLGSHWRNQLDKSTKQFHSGLDS